MRRRQTGLTAAEAVQERERSQSMSPAVARRQSAGQGRERLFRNLMELYDVPLTAFPLAVMQCTMFIGAAGSVLHMTLLAICCACRLTVSCRGVP